DSGVHGVDIGNLDLEIDAASIGMLERRRPEAPSRPGRFLEHQMSAGEIEIGEAFLRPLEHHRESNDVDIEGERPPNVLDIKLGDDFGTHDASGLPQRVTNS